MRQGLKSEPLRCRKDGLVSELARSDDLNPELMAVRVKVQPEVALALALDDVL